VFLRSVQGRRRERPSRASATHDATIAIMKFFVKAVVTGFALSLGSALFKKVQRKLGLGEPDKAPAEAVKQDGATDPNLQHQFH
jgi:hypothetical protein